MGRVVDTIAGMIKSAIEMKIVFFGTGDLGVPALRSLIEFGARPLLVVTSPDKPAGRGLKLSHSPIKEVALHANIPVLQPEKINEPEVVDRIRQLGADLGIIIAYGQKIGPVLINIFPRGIINLHASLLPKYRGAAPINWAIINGERETGLTVMQINEQIDAGMILNQIVTPIDPLERADELYARLAEMGPQLVLETIFQIQEGTADPKPQDLALVTKAPKMSKAICPIDWTLPAQTIVNRIRGLWPWPTATSIYRDQDHKTVPVALARAQAVSENECYINEKQPGMILADFTIATGQGRVKLLELKPAGSKLMKWQDFINGRHVKPGGRFVSIEGCDGQVQAKG